MTETLYFDLGKEAAAPRLFNVTQEIGRDITGLKGKIFVHVDYDRLGKIHGIRFSEKGKDKSTLDRVFAALGDVVTDIISSLQKERLPQ